MHRLIFFFPKEGTGALIRDFSSDTQLARTVSGWHTSLKTQQQWVRDPSLPWMSVSELGTPLCPGCQSFLGCSLPTPHWHGCFILCLPVQAVSHQSGSRCPSLLRTLGPTVGPGLAKAKVSSPGVDPCPGWVWASVCPCIHDLCKPKASVDPSVPSPLQIWLLKHCLSC